ncbi:type II toxin-antitoxin system RelE/ParE family toxin [Sulfuricurvum sp.]|uniref:type II toxin-antitoxin system RelE/ParE family toxin n=1 Tax=Sulfuricurvum sp. TaxID=2025608 RepID=UPI00344D2557
MKQSRQRILAKVKAYIETLTDNPRKGRLNDDGNRELIHQGYTIPYLIDGDNIVILFIQAQPQPIISIQMIHILNCRRLLWSSGSISR